METNKFNDDTFITNKDLSLIGGIEINELLLLEMEFLNKIKWKMNVDEENFKAYTKKLQTLFYLP